MASPRPGSQGQIWWNSRLQINIWVERHLQPRPLKVNGSLTFLLLPKMRWHYVPVDLYFRQRSSEGSICCGEPSLPVFLSCRCHSQFCRLLQFQHWNLPVMMTESEMYGLIYGFLWALGAFVLVQILCECSDLIRLSGMIFPTPEVKMSVDAFQRSGGFLGHSGVLFPILSMTDCFCFRSPLTHSCTDTYNLHAAGPTAIHSRPLSCTRAMTHWCFPLLDISFLSSFSASARPLELPASLGK